MAKILLAEDDLALSRIIRDSLTNQLFLVEEVSDGIDAEHLIQSYGYDMIILDWDLPGKFGVEVCRDFRKQGGKTPVLILTGKKSISEKEIGFECGADDYLTKPFHLTELGLRVKALLRRPAEFVSGILRAGAIALYPDQFLVTLDGRELQLARKEFTLLEFFMRNPNRVFSAEALLNRVWCSESEASNEAIRATIVRLRKKLDASGKSSLIQNLHGLGYKFVPGDVAGEVEDQ